MFHTPPSGSHQQHPPEWHRQREGRPAQKLQQPLTVAAAAQPNSGGPMLARGHDLGTAGKGWDNLPTQSYTSCSRLGYTVRHWIAHVTVFPVLTNKLHVHVQPLGGVTPVRSTGSRAKTRVDFVGKYVNGWGGWVGGCGWDPPELMRHIDITVWQGNPTQCTRLVEQTRHLPYGWTCFDSLPKSLHHCVHKSELTNEPASSRGGSWPLPGPPA
jgi:hypothetical protein